MSLDGFGNSMQAFETSNAFGGNLFSHSNLDHLPREPSDTIEQIVSDPKGKEFIAKLAKAKKTKKKGAMSVNSILEGSTKM